MKRVLPNVRPVTRQSAYDRNPYFADNSAFDRKLRIEPYFLVRRFARPLRAKQVGDEPVSDTRLWGALWLGMATCVSAMAAEGPATNGSVTSPAASLAAEGGSARSAAAAGPITRAILEYAAAATGGGEIIQVQAVDLPSLGQPLDALSGVGSGGGQVESQLNLASLSRLVDTAWRSRQPRRQRLPRLRCCRAPLCLCTRRPTWAACSSRPRT